MASNRGGRGAPGRGRGRGGRGAAVSGPMDALLGRGPVGALAVPDGLHYGVHQRARFAIGQAVCCKSKQLLLEKSSSRD